MCVCVPCALLSYTTFIYKYVDLQSGDFIPATALVGLWSTTTHLQPRLQFIGDFSETITKQQKQQNTFHSALLLTLCYKGSLSILPHHHVTHFKVWITNAIYLI